MNVNADEVFFLVEGLEFFCLFGVFEGECYFVFGFGFVFPTVWLIYLTSWNLHLICKRFLLANNLVSTVHEKT